MLTLNNLSQQIVEYRLGHISLDDFEDWFRDGSRGAYSVPEVSEACGAIEAAFSKFYFQGMDEDGLKAELANAVRPFVQWKHVSHGVFVLNNRSAASQLQGESRAVASGKTEVIRKPQAHEIASAVPANHPLVLATVQA